MSQRVGGVKGMNDLLPPDIAVWHFLEARARETFRRFGFQEIRTPVIEDTALFVRSVGQTAPAGASPCARKTRRPRCVHTSSTQ